MLMAGVSHTLLLHLPSPRLLRAREEELDRARRRHGLASSGLRQEGSL